MKRLSFTDAEGMKLNVECDGSGVNFEMEEESIERTFYMAFSYDDFFELAEYVDNERPKEIKE